MNESAKTNLLGLSRESMKAFFADMGEKAFRTTQVMKWVHHQGVTDFDQMTDLSKPLRARLKETAEIRTPEVVFDKESADGTRKWLFQLDGGNSVEAVYIPEEGRATLCVSSQVGCTLTCSFCSTGRQGYNRNLTAAEIVGQIYLANQLVEHEVVPGRKITNVVFMGMGEPLANVNNVVEATRVMIDDLGYGLGKRRVTISTAGIVPAMDRLSEAVDVSLAVSLHAPNDALRDELVPINRKYPLDELMAACDRFLPRSKIETITYEYVVLDGVNDSLENARELRELLRNRPAKVNLIPFNPFPGSGYERPSNNRVHAFGKVLLDAGIRTTIRKTRGDDIDAACGQLVGQVQDRSRREQKLQRMNIGLRQ